MNLHPCCVCKSHFETNDLAPVEGKMICYLCTKTCQHCGKPYSYGDDHHCYDCLESETVSKMNTIKQEYFNNK